MREFDADTGELGNVPAYEFSLRGVAFKAKPRMTPQDFGAWLKFVSDLGKGELTGDPFLIVSEMIERTLLPECRERWRELLAQDVDVPIRFGTLIEIGDAISENAADRPTTPPSPSGNSDTNGVTRSTDDSVTRAPAASTLSPPTPA